MFDWLRTEAPAYFHHEPDGPGFWCLTRYDDVIQATRDWHVHSSAKGSNIPNFYEVGPAMLNMMINTDPPYHTKLRNLVRKGFTPRMVGALEPHLRELCGRILDRIGPLGECDFVTEVLHSFLALAHHPGGVDGSRRRRQCQRKACAMAESARFGSPTTGRTDQTGIVHTRKTGANVTQCRRLA